MVYTLIITDDDMMIRKGLNSLIPWEDLGFRLIGLFDDGKPVLDHLRQQSVDVILTDIRMHEIGGLDIAQEVYERHLPTQVIILSGYQEFEFAQRAVHYGVREYLLKPISLDLLTETFQKLYAELEHRMGKQTQIIKMEEHLSELEMQRDNLFLQDAYFGKLLQEDAFEKRCQINHYDADMRFRRSFLFQISFDGNPALISSVINLLSEHYTFHSLEQKEHEIIGLTIENTANSTHGDEPTASDIAARIQTLTGMYVQVNPLAKFSNLRQITLYRNSKEKTESSDPVVRAEVYMREHYAENITLNTVAAKIYVNSAYLSRVFHQKTGKTFTDALTAIRMEAAKRLLIQSNLPTAEVARECGYVDVKGFFRSFKRYTGISPGDWRMNDIQSEQK